jgi:hypothetical protein
MRFRLQRWLHWPRRRGKRLPRWPGDPRRRRQRRRAGAAMFTLLLLAWLLLFEPRPTWPRTDILAAIRFVESSDRDDVPDGDGGKAIGPYQIHEVYWRDAARFEVSLGGGYQQCRQRAYAERVVDAYMRKWAPIAWERGDAETIARVHNGGPDGADQASTLAYWRRVRARLP